jgi:hypothetical protein
VGRQIQTLVAKYQPRVLLLDMSRLFNARAAIERCQARKAAGGTAA